MNDINISYNDGHGKMCIHLDNFLPTTQIRFKMLLSIIELDYNNQEELKATLEQYMMERLAAEEGSLVENARAYSNYHQEVADLKRLVETEKHPNGIWLKDDELKKAKVQLSLVSREEKRTQAQIKKTNSSLTEWKSI